MDSQKVEDKEVWEALSNLELFSGKYVKPGDPDETSLPPEQSNFTPSVSKLLSFTQQEFRPEDSSHFEKHGVSAASVEAEPCVVDIENSNNERWTKKLEEFSGRLFGNFSLQPEQREVINATMIGHDVFAEMPAGLGSRVTYELPAHLCAGMTVVVVPFAPVVAVQVEDPVLDKKSMGLSDLMELTEQRRTLGEHVTERCEFKLLYVTADDTITENELLLEHLKTLDDRGLLARIVIEEAQLVCKRDKGLGIFKKEFPEVPLVALASIDKDSVRDEVVRILGLVNYIHFKKRHIHSRVSSSKQSKQGKCEPTSSKCSLTIEKQNSFGPDSPNHNIVDEDLCHASHVGVESMDMRLVLPSWSIEESKNGKRHRRQTKLFDELRLLNSIYGEHFLPKFNSGIDFSISLRVLLSKEHLNDETTILKINWTETQVGIHIEPRDGVNDPLTFYGKLQSAAKRKHIEGSIMALLNAVRKAFGFGKIPIMVGHIIYRNYDRDYIQFEELGRGCYGRVYRCKAKLEGTYCAIKKIRFTKSEEVQRVLSEVKMLSLARHPNVVGYHQAWIEDYREPKNLYTYQSGSSSYGRREMMMYIHMELCKESLESKLAKEKKLQTDMAWSYSRQILEALQCIQGKDIIHRDLKPDNIFIDDCGTVKIGDFGLATRKDVSSTTNSSPVGADLYRAPEMRKGDPTYKPTNKPTDKVDMYAFGLILFQLFGPGECSEKEMLKLRESPRQVCKKYKVDETAKHLILELLQTDPLKRPSAADLLRRLDRLEVTRKNTQETEIQQRPEQEHIQIESQSSLMIKVHTHQDKRQKTVGIGITATDSMGQLQAGWALRERMSADPLQDKAVAVRLALWNAIDQGWRNIKVELDDRELVECIKETRNSNQLMAIHDIQSISNSIHKCSFSFANSGYVESIKLSLHALNICSDEKWVNPNLRC